MTGGLESSGPLVNNQDMNVRPARVEDAKSICSLINYWAERGRMLHRSLESVYQTLREFIVAVDEDGEVIGCAAMGIYWANLGEAKSLAVAKSAHGKGVGRRLMTSVIRMARKLGVTRLFALTYEKDFFLRQGFTVIDRDLLPEKVWQACIHCPKVDCCDETAMMLRLDRPVRRRRSPAGRQARRTGSGR